MSDIEKFLAEANQFASIPTFSALVRFLESGIPQFPREPKLFVDLGQVYVQAGDWQKALLYSSKAIELDATNTDAWYNMGRCHLYRGDLQKARESFIVALRHAPDDIEILDNLAMIEAELSLRSSPRASLVLCKLNS